MHGTNNRDVPPPRWLIITKRIFTLLIAPILIYCAVYVFVDNLWAVLAIGFYAYGRIVWRDGR